MCVPVTKLLDIMRSGPVDRHLCCTVHDVHPVDGPIFFVLVFFFLQEGRALEQKQLFILLSSKS